MIEDLQDILSSNVDLYEKYEYWCVRWTNSNQVTYVLIVYLLIHPMK